MHNDHAPNQVEIGVAQKFADQEATDRINMMELFAEELPTQVDQATVSTRSTFATASTLGGCFACFSTLATYG